jgi:hypothetical protein
MDEKIPNVEEELARWTFGKAEKVGSVQTRTVDGQRVLTPFFTMMQVMIQTNGYDCALFALAEILLQLDGEHRRFLQEDMAHVRSHIAYQLLCGSIGLNIYKSSDPRRVTISDAPPEIKTISPRRASDGVDRNATPITHSYRTTLEPKPTVQASKPKKGKR